MIAFSGPSSHLHNPVWISLHRVLLALNGVLNRKFASLVDDRREVCTGHQ
jgi:hypothetical protein